MIKIILTGLLVFGTALLGTTSSVQGSNLGAHVKLTVYDYKDGFSDGIKGHQYAGMAFNEMIIYFSSSLGSNVFLDLQPLIDASTGATPRFGRDIGDNKNINAQPTFREFRKAVLTFSLPYQMEMSVGIVRPRFTWDYGAELFWEEQINGGKFSANNYLGAMHETGIELYKPFELPNMSLPVYFYLLNGGPGGQKNLFNDNNNTPTVMIHVEPEIGSLRLHGSLARGKWDEDGKYNMTRYAAGIAYQWFDWAARAEVAGGNWENSIPARVPQHATPFGYYGKVLYEINHWAKAMLHYDYAKHNFNGFFSPQPGEEVYRTFSPGLIFTFAPGAMVQVQYDMANWRRWKSDTENQTLKFNRLTAGIRATF